MTDAPHAPPEWVTEFHRGIDALDADRSPRGHAAFVARRVLPCLQQVGLQPTSLELVDGDCFSYALVTSATQRASLDCYDDGGIVILLTRPGVTAFLEELDTFDADRVTEALRGLQGELDASK